MFIQLSQTEAMSASMKKRVSAAPWGMLAISAEWDVRREAGEGKAEAAAGP